MYVDLRLRLNKNPKAKMGNLLCGEEEIIGYVERNMTTTDRKDDLMDAIYFNPQQGRLELCSADGDKNWYLTDSGEIIKSEQ